MPKCIYCALNGNWTPYECVFECSFISCHFKQEVSQHRSHRREPLQKHYRLWSPFPEPFRCFTNSYPLAKKLGMDHPNKCSVALQLHYTSSLINLRNRVPHLHFTICFGVAGWPWYKLHYFLSAAVPSNSPSAAYEWYITTDSCDLGSNAVLRFHTLQLHLLLELVAPKNIRLQVLTCACQN